MNKKFPGLYCLLTMLLAACAQAEPTLPAPTLPPPTETPLPTQTLTPTQTPTPSETPLPTITPEGEIGSTWIRPKDGMAMVYVPKGAFIMGSSSGDPDEQPAHEVYLDAYWIDQTEVTYTMFARFTPARSGRQAADGVSWEQAAEYCAWVGSRLPTEAEWEKAARGTDERVYPWGNQPPTGDLVNFADRNSRLNWEDTNVDDRYGAVAPVGSYPAGASIYSALDMAGNVAEWVNDWYDQAYYSASPLTNPRGPGVGDFRVLRGGSWFSTAAGVRTTDRSWYIPEAGTDYGGFRCAQSTVAP
ncbi:MAG: SUMF1/EgtB/PvdO family nonheme iron enzyme [Chloroflexi bacterium]|nr:SUMF1/EgtB/PvdO family nonheme iron enzyme [Chloroflexota bacterium]